MRGLHVYWFQVVQRVPARTSATKRSASQRPRRLLGFLAKRLGCARLHEDVDEFASAVPLIYFIERADYWDVVIGQPKGADVVTMKQPPEFGASDITIICSVTCGCGSLRVSPGRFKQDLIFLI